MHIAQDPVIGQDTIIWYKVMYIIIIYNQFIISDFRNSFTDKGANLSNKSFINMYVFQLVASKRNQDQKMCAKHLLRLT